MSQLGPYELNQIYCCECSEGMAALPDNCIDFWLTSPPYDDLRSYSGYTFDFERIAAQLYRVTKPGGVGVWVVADETKDGSESGTSFRQALGFMAAGFNLHDTMIFNKFSPFPSNNRYWQAFEYMFIFSKGTPSTFNPLKESRDAESKKRQRGRWNGVLFRQEDGTLERTEGNATDRLNNRDINNRMKTNIWRFDVGGGNSASDTIAFDHPAIFPEALARDHILSWSNPGNICLDPMVGSGTAAKQAHLLGRHYLGFDISEEYCQLARRRVANVEAQPFLMPFHPEPVEGPSVEANGKPAQLGLLQDKP